MINLVRSASQSRSTITNISRSNHSPGHCIDSMLCNMLTLKFGCNNNNNDNNADHDKQINLFSNLNSETTDELKGQQQRQQVKQTTVVSSGTGRAAGLKFEIREQAEAAQKCKDNISQEVDSGRKDKPLPTGELDTTTAPGNCSDLALGGCSEANSGLQLEITAIQYQICDNLTSSSSNKTLGRHVVRSGSIDAIREQAVGEQCDTGELPADDTRAIDSRSILTNKDKLKRFWEQRMEMEFKVKQKQEQLQDESIRSDLKQQQRQQEQLISGKLVDFDENNNNNNDNNNKESKCDQKKSSKLVGVGQVEGYQQGRENGRNGQVIGMKEEEQQDDEDDQQHDWRSCSPNDDSTSGQTRQAQTECSNQGHQHEVVSPELISAKLRAYERKQADNGGLDASNKRNRLGQKWLANRTETSGSDATYGTEDGNNQLMSIDPTLCHQSSACERDQLMEDGTHVEINSGHVVGNDNCNGDISTCEQHQQDELEEQTVNEEFSSSNSSFGPMSIPISRPGNIGNNNGNTTTESNEATSSATSVSCSSGTSDEDEQNSTQSGSVLTVICNNDSIVKAGITEETTESQQRQQPELCQHSGDEAISYAATENGYGANELITCLEDEDDQSNSDAKQDDDEGSSSSSNIGVAFESLHFEDEIKSSKNEQVDEDLLLGCGGAGASKKRPACNNRVSNNSAFVSNNSAKQSDQSTSHSVNAVGSSINNANYKLKFNSKEVNSVCNFISNAISDATRQVDFFIKSNGRSSTTGERALPDKCHDDVHDRHSPGAESDIDGIQRARFVQQDELIGLSSSPSLANGFAPRNDNTSSLAKTEIEQCNNLAPRQELGRGESKSHGRLAVSNQFVNGNYDVDIDDDDATSYEHRTRQEALAVSLEPQQADLTSIFEANVRREIERFESNCMLKKSSFGGGGNKLTEWKIAEEIRHFNERELELKQRAGATPSLMNLRDQVDGGKPSVNSLTPLADEANSTNGRRHSCQVAQSACWSNHNNSQTRYSTKPLQQLESVVRCGKTYQIPKCSSQTNADQLHYQPPPRQSHELQMTRSIKLSSTSHGADNCDHGGSSGGDNSNNIKTTTISMHKFISSGGKRFVYTSNSGGGGGSSGCIQTVGGGGGGGGGGGDIVATDARLNNKLQASTPLYHRNFLTKSLSNLSSSGSTTAPRPVVDYRAVDSLRCKEVPNVMPGLTKKTIETFSRLDTTSNRDKNSVCGGHRKTRAPETFGPLTRLERPDNLRASACMHSMPHHNQVQQHERQQQQHQPQQQQHKTQRKLSPNSQVPSAEWKIQEELREMKAREAELKSLHRGQHMHKHHIQQQLSACEPNNSSTYDDDGGLGGLGDNDQIGDPKRPSTSVNVEYKQIDGSCQGAQACNSDDDVDDNGGGLLKPVVNESSSCQTDPMTNANNKLSYSSDSLYPIKQAIDSFRRLNAAAECSVNNVGVGGSAARRPGTKMPNASRLPVGGQLLGLDKLRQGQK